MTQPQASWQLYYQLIKPGIVYANVMTGVSGYLLASKFNLKIGQFIALIIGMSCLIAGSCVANNLIDRGIDKKMERTLNRALVTQQIKAKTAVMLSAGLIVIGFLVLLKTNKLVVLTGLLSVIFYVVIYGFFKRHSIYSTLVGSLPGAASLVAGYLAYQNRFNFEAVLLLFIMVSWQMAHFYSIAVYRLKDYQQAGLPLWPINKGLDSTKLQIKLFIYGFLLVSLIMTILGYVGYSFLIAMVIMTAYWLHLAYKDSSNSRQWARKIFIFSLLVLLVMSVMLPVSRLLV
jgi:protoheme IX farnesyltransferase